MRILFDMGHPADYHLFKNILSHFREIGDEILIVVRNREGMVSQLLEENSEPYILLGGNARGLANKLVGLVVNDVRFLRIASKFDPDVFISLGSPYSGHVSFLLKKPHIAFADTESSRIVQLLLAPPFTTIVIVPSSSFKEISFRNYVSVDSYKELAYLHPKYFKSNPIVLKEADLKKDEKFVIVRFSAYDAVHDIGINGLRHDSKERLVFELSKHARVLVSSESELESNLKPFMLNINPSRMHDLLSFASLYVGEGGTMGSEAAVLGTPSIFINPSKLGCIEDLKQQGLIIQFEDPNNMLDEIIEYCRSVLIDESKVNRQKALRERMLEDKEDMATMLIREIEKIRND